MSMVFEHIFTRERSRLKRFAAKILGNSQDAEDVVQDTYVKLSHRDLSENDKGLVFATIKTLAIDQIRRQKRQTQNIHDSLATEQQCETINPEIITSSKNNLSIFLNAIENMPKRRGQILLLSRVDGLSYKKIAKMLDISESTVEKEMAAAIAFCHKWKQSHD
ncbi:RNA polymerase sigma factor [Bartonella sp. HY761]|uniref:RNA polymerase sigma factor n=1 Tax=Bartonella sp. HY761 TaxID=2979330 RepID=UPI0021FE0DA4|nr:RNA polymerase sigma factor [Bartonella sp. HY761]UXN06252.1 RNA polymerase sigma factor [Bartonella sp. HY761]